MKMLKKMAALLLAGVMALALLTACGEDSTPSFGKQVEADDKINAIKVTAEELAKLQNPQANGVADVIGQYNAEIIAVGVATKTINGNTYMAVAMTYKVNQPAQ